MLLYFFAILVLARRTELAVMLVRVSLWVNVMRGLFFFLFLVVGSSLAALSVTGVASSWMSKLASGCLELCSLVIVPLLTTSFFNKQQCLRLVLY